MAKKSGKNLDYEAFSFKEEKKLSEKAVSREEVTIEDLHKDLEKKLQEQGFIFDKRKFVFQGEHLTFGDKLAGSVAKFGGSWTFILLFVSFIFAWMGLNVVFLLNKGFDPIPFILLNLILSCVASMQAPIIMMSQNRQAQQDRKQEELNLEKDIVDFKQDRLDLILDQKEWEILTTMDGRIKRIEDYLINSGKGSKSKVKRAAVKSKKS